VIDETEGLGLISRAPSRGPGDPPLEESALYGRFVGEWVFDNEYYRDDGSVASSAGEWNFAWALEGRAIVDLWTYPTRAERARSGEGPGGLGVTVRTYDAAANAWRIAWSSVDGRCLLFSGRRVGDEIVQEGEERGVPLRWIFFDIEAESFSWRAEDSSDGGRTWRRTQLMRVRRRAGP